MNPLLAISLLPNISSLSGSSASASSSLGSLGAGLASTGVSSSLGNLIWEAPIAIVVVVIIFFILNRKPNAAKNVNNKAIIYSMHHNSGLYTYPFTIERKTDELGNVTATLAHIIKPKKTGIGENLTRMIDSIRGRKHPEAEQGIPFEEKLAILMEGKYWIAGFTLETNSQIPIIPHFSQETGFEAKRATKTLLSENPAFKGENRKYLKDAYKVIDAMPSYQPANSLKEAIDAMELNLERRVARIKSAVMAVQNYVSNAQPAKELGGILLVSFILIFIAILVLAFVLNSLSGVIKASSSTISTASTLIQTLKYLVPANVVT